MIWGAIIFGNTHIYIYNTLPETNSSPPETFAQILQGLNGKPQLFSSQSHLLGCPRKLVTG